MTSAECLLLIVGVIYCTAETTPLPETTPDKEKSCGPPPTIYNGDITETTKLNYSSGSSVTYKCANFYKLEGNEVIRCSDGEWGQKPTCREPCTVTPSDMTQNNIYLKYMSGDDKRKKIYSTHSDSMTFECIPGYEIGDTKRLRVQCWHGVIKYPKCVKQGSCVLQETEMALHNLRYSESPDIENGQAVVFKCLEGMVSEESLETTCQNGNIKYPRCTAPWPCDPPKISNAKLIPMNDSYDSGSSINIECEELCIHNGPDDATCEDGQWSELPQCLKPCTVSGGDLEKNHVELMSPEDASRIHKHDMEIRIKCKRKYRRRGQVLALCNDGVMKYQRCFSGKTCYIDQQQMDDNFLELDEKHDGEPIYGEGETVQFTCKIGYFNRTSLTGECAKPTSRGMVSAEPMLAYPTCITPCTVRTADMLQNKIQLKYEDDKTKEMYSTHLDSTSFECAPGYDIPDKTSLRVQCLDGVLKFPKCIMKGFCIIKEPEMASNDIRHSTNTVIENGQRVAFECIAGSVPEDNLEGKCEGGRIKYPKCISSRSGEICSPPPNIYHGDIVGTIKFNYQSGSSVKYRCAQLYVLEGNEEIVCRDGKWETEPVCKMPCTITTSKMEEYNIRLKYKFGEDKTQKIYAQHLDYISFECAPGYDISDTTNLRVQCFNGEVMYPKCSK